MSETLDWARTLLLLNIDTIDEQTAKETLHILLKYQTDIAKAAKELDVDPEVMRRGIAALAVAVVVNLGAATASAGFQQDTSLDLIPPTVAPGGLVIAEYLGCVDGQIIEFTLPGNPSQTISCFVPNGGGSPGTSRAVFPAPRTAGSYPVSGQIVGVPESQRGAGLTVSGAGAVPPDDLAETGPTSGPAIPMAATALAVGLGLLGAARFRRRPTVTT